MYVCSLPCVKLIASGVQLQSTEGSARCPGMTERAAMGGGGREAQEGGDVCIHTDSCCCIAETNTT